MMSNAPGCSKSVLKSGGVSLSVYVMPNLMDGHFEDERAVLHIERLATPDAKTVIGLIVLAAIGTLVHRYATTGAKAHLRLIGMMAVAAMKERQRAVVSGRLRWLSWICRAAE